MYKALKSFSLMKEQKTTIKEVHVLCPDQKTMEFIVAEMEMQAVQDQSGMS